MFPPGLEHSNGKAKGVLEKGHNPNFNNDL